AERSLVEPRADVEPLLFAGDEIVEIVYRDMRSGIVAGVLRGARSLDGVPLWWGGPGYAENFGPPRIALERNAAVAAGIVALPAGTTRRVVRVNPSGPLLRDRGVLYELATSAGRSAAGP